MNKVLRCYIRVGSVLLTIMLSACSQDVLKEYYPDGSLKSECEVLDTVKNGKCIEYYSDGTIKEVVEWKLGKREGKYEEFYEDGKRKAITYWKNDTLNGPIQTFFENGNPMEVYTVVNGVAEGEYKMFYENGDLKEVYQFKEGHPQGFVLFYEHGKLKEKKEYLFLPKHNTDVLNQYRKYDINGNEIIDNTVCYYEFLSKDTLLYNDTLKLDLFVYCGGYSNVRLIIGDFDESFNLRSSTSLDTIEGTNNIVSFSLRTITRGKKMIRGIIYSYNDTVINGINQQDGREFYLNREIFIK